MAVTRWPRRALRKLHLRALARRARRVYWFHPPHARARARLEGRAVVHSLAKASFLDAGCGAFLEKAVCVV